MKTPEEIVDILEAEAHLNPGNIIPREILEFYFERTRTEEWTWLGPFLAVKQEIESRGYFCTTRGQDPGSLLILSAREMAYRCQQINKNVGKRLTRVKESIVNADIQDLLEEEQARHYHEMKKLILQLNAWKNPLSNI